MRPRVREVKPYPERQDLTDAQHPGPPPIFCDANESRIPDVDGVKRPVGRELYCEFEFLFVYGVGGGYFVDGVRDLDRDVLVLASEFLRYAGIFDTL